MRGKHGRSRGTTTVATAPIAIAGRYRLGSRRIGRGGSAQVFPATDLETKQRVAIKLIPRTWVDVDRFEREATVAQRLDGADRWLVVPSNWGHDDGTGHFWLAMPFMAGGSADRLIKRQRPTPEADWIIQAARIFTDAAAGLAFLHTRGALHRDVKPANVLLDAFGQAKLGDFTIIRFRHDAPLTGTGQLIGSPGYIAPEVLDGAEPTRGADIWALAVFAFELLGTDHPFGRRMRWHLPDATDWPRLHTLDRAIPDGVDAVIRVGAATEPGERFSTVPDFARAIIAVLDLSDELQAELLAVLAEVESSPESPTACLPIRPAQDAPVLVAEPDERDQRIEDLERERRRNQRLLDLALAAKTAAEDELVLARADHDQALAEVRDTEQEKSREAMDRVLEAADRAKAEAAKASEKRTQRQQDALLDQCVEFVRRQKVEIGQLGQKVTALEAERQRSQARHRDELHRARAATQAQARAPEAVRAATSRRDRCSPRLRRRLGRFCLRLTVLAGAALSFALVEPGDEAEVLRHLAQWISAIGRVVG